jgi:hypothetical protein
MWLRGGGADRARRSEARAAASSVSLTGLREKLQAEEYLEAAEQDRGRAEQGMNGARPRVDGHVPRQQRREREQPRMRC